METGEDEFNQANTAKTDHLSRSPWWSRIGYDEVGIPYPPDINLQLRVDTV